MDIDKYYSAFKGRHTLKLHEYRDLLEGIDPPTDYQIADFVEFACNAHSWYKHLPLTPPGVLFCFYLDPWAGMDLVVDEDNKTIYLERTEGNRGIHHSWMPTKKYRKQYGSLSYHCLTGTSILFSVIVASADGDQKDGLLGHDPKCPLILTREEHFAQLPMEVIEASSVSLTGVIHRGAAEFEMWHFSLRRFRREPTWPEETGGAETLVDITRLYNEYQKFASRERDYDFSEEINKKMDGGQPNSAFIRDRRRTEEFDQRFRELFEPERKRLQGKMVAAIKRMLSLIHT